MGPIVIAVFRPKPGKEADLLACARDHLPVLRAEGLATSLPSLVLRSKDGSLLEIFEWASHAAIDEAHSNPRVLALWERYEACCDYATLDDLDEARMMFPDFERVTL
jgi:quinol monooxygenase YgiN